MKIAVACKKDNQVSHFGFCDAFAVYDFDLDDLAPRSKTLVPADGKHGHEVLTALMQELDISMVLCDGMGSEARNALLRLGIMPVTGYQGDADQGAIDLMRGNIPIVQSSCDSCGGDCSSGKCRDM